MFTFEILTEEARFSLCGIKIKADSYKLVREKGGFVRYEFYVGPETIATFRADYVKSIIKVIS